MILLKNNNNDFFKCNFDFSRHAKMSNTCVYNRVFRYARLSGVTSKLKHAPSCARSHNKLVSFRTELKQIHDDGVHHKAFR